MIDYLWTNIPGLNHHTNGISKIAEFLLQHHHI